MDYTKMCKHLDTRFNHHESEYVCSHCGFIIDCRLPQIDYNFSNQHKKLPNDLNEFLLDACDRIHLTSTSIHDIICEYLNFRNNPHFKKVKSENLIAYSIYYTLKKYDIGRTIEMIASVTGVNSRKIWKCETIDRYQPKQINILNVLTPIYSSFNLTKSDCDQIITISTKFQDRDYTQSTLTATLVYWYCKAINKKKTYI